MEPNNSGNNVAGALTYPVNRSDDEDEETAVASVQPRHPRNLQGLLRFVMDATKAEDAPGSSDLGPIEEERRKFLEEAFKSLTVDVAQVLLRAIRVLSDPEKMNSIQLGQPLPDPVVTSFSNIQVFVTDIDVANDFYKLGGFSIFPVCLGSENAMVRSEAYTVLAEVCQNNHYCQSRAVDNGLLNMLLTLMQTEEGMALSKCLYAISCMSRSYDPACRMLTEQGGCTLFTQMLSSDDLRVRTKVAFLISYLARNYTEAKEKFLENGTIKKIADELDKGLDASTSCLLIALLALIEEHDPVAMQQLKYPSTRLKKVLEKLYSLPEMREAEYDDERASLRSIMLIFEKAPDIEAVNDDGIDR